MIADVKAIAEQLWADVVCFFKGHDWFEFPPKEIAPRDPDLANVAEAVNAIIRDLRQNGVTRFCKRCRRAPLRRTP